MCSSRISPGSMLLVLLLPSLSNFFFLKKKFLSQHFITNVSEKTKRKLIDDVLSLHLEGGWVSPAPTGGPEWGCHYGASSRPGSPPLWHRPLRCPAPAYVSFAYLEWEAAGSEMLQESIKLKCNLVWILTWTSCIRQVTQADLIHSSYTVSRRKKTHLSTEENPGGTCSPPFEVRNLPISCSQASSAKKVSDGAGGWELCVPRVKHHADIFGYNCRLGAALHLQMMKEEVNLTVGHTTSPPDAKKAQYCTSK